VAELLAAGHEVRCLVRSPSKLSDVAWRDDVSVVEGSVTDPDALTRASTRADVASHLVHSMGTSPRFEAVDRRAGACFRDAPTAADVGRIVYLGTAMNAPELPRSALQPLTQNAATERPPPAVDTAHRTAPQSATKPAAIRDSRLLAARRRLRRRLGGG
jgi:uncharacterized protein YbjT (DUF2867 family)